MSEPQIKASLIRLLEAIKRADGVTVSDEMAKVEALVAADRRGLPAQLVHFIDRRSYAKALAYLETEGVA